MKSSSYVEDCIMEIVTKFYSYSINENLDERKKILEDLLETKLPILTSAQKQKTAEPEKMEQDEFATGFAAIMKAKERKLFNTENLKSEAQFYLPPWEAISNTYVKAVVKVLLALNKKVHIEAYEEMDFTWKKFELLNAIGGYQCCGFEYKDIIKYRRPSLKQTIVGAQMGEQSLVEIHNKKLLENINEYSMFKIKHIYEQRSCTEMNELFNLMGLYEIGIIILQMEKIPDRDKIVIGADSIHLQNYGWNFSPVVSFNENGIALRAQNQIQRGSGSLLPDGRPIDADMYPSLII